MKTSIKIPIILIFMMLPLSIFAQRTTDIENSKDYPLISRFNGSIIEFYKETKWGSYKLPVNTAGKIDFEAPHTIEGKVTRIQYSVSPDNVSEFVLQNYKAALKNSGYTILIAIAGDELGVSDRPHTWKEKYYESGGYYNGLGNIKFGLGPNFPIWKNDQSFIAASGHQDDKDIYVVVYTVVDENYTLITQDVIEVEAPKTGLVTAQDIASGITANGHIAIYDILFDTGKSEIKPESSGAIKNIADFIKANPARKFYIVGHTDNTGSFAGNMSLSENRAKSVMNELISKYEVNREQLNAFGVASLVPISSNASEEGKAKNRRVEIVEQ